MTKEVPIKRRCKGACLFSPQVMYPWRRIFKDLFRHDRKHGQLYSLRHRDSNGRPVVVSQLGQHLHNSGADWHDWTKPLAGLLEMLEDEMPTLPPLNMKVKHSASLSAANYTLFWCPVFF